MGINATRLAEKGMFHSHALKGWATAPETWWWQVAALTRTDFSEWRGQGADLMWIWWCLQSHPKKGGGTFSTNAAAWKTREPSGAPDVSGVGAGQLFTSRHPEYYIAVAIERRKLWWGLGFTLRLFISQRCQQPKPHGMFILDSMIS